MFSVPPALSPAWVGQPTMRAIWTAQWSCGAKAWHWPARRATRGRWRSHSVVLGRRPTTWGDLAGSARHLEEASAIARQAGRTDIESWEIGGLANVARRQGDLARATKLQRRALAMETTLGDRRQIAISLEHLSQIPASAGRGERAARLLGAATALRELIGAAQPVPERADTEQTVAGVRAAIGERLWAT